MGSNPSLYLFMKILLKAFLLSLAACILSVSAFAQTKQPYILEHESQIAKTEPGTHNGGGNTTGYTSFQMLMA